MSVRQTVPFETIRSIGFRDSDGLVGLVRDPAFLPLGVLTPAWSTWALVGYLAVTALAALPTRDHRGLSHVLAGMDLEVAGAPAQPSDR